METFTLYLKLGWDHLVSPDALDHQLFLLALSASYTLRSWRKLLVLITAFTLGHCLTLALGATGMVRLPSYWVELLIPASIGLAALGNLGFVTGRNERGTGRISYPLTALFGLVHGLGFANTLHQLLGREQSLLMPLFGFNIGIEIGQMAVLLLILGFQTVVMRIAKITHTTWAALASGLALAGSVWMVVGRV